MGFSARREVRAALGLEGMVSKRASLAVVAAEAQETEPAETTAEPSPAAFRRIASLGELEPYGQFSIDMKYTTQPVACINSEHDHVVGTYYKYYSDFPILAERDHWCVVERFYKLPILNLRASSLAFMYMESPNLIRSIQQKKLV